MNFVTRINWITHIMAVSLCFLKLSSLSWLVANGQTETWLRTVDVFKGQEKSTPPHTSEVEPRACVAGAWGGCYSNTIT